MSRALRLACPRCGQTRLFRNLISMHRSCSNCHLKYEREAGFFLGAIYFNYGLTALIAFFLFAYLWLSRTLSHQQSMLVTMAFAVVFPIWFFRYARSLWLGFDYYWDRPPDDKTAP